MVEVVTLESVMNAFARWRTVRRHQDPIPVELLRMAALAAEQMGVAKVAKNLGLNGSKLSREVESLFKERANAQRSKVFEPEENVSQALQFSRIEPFLPFSEALPDKEIQTRKPRIQAELTLKNGIVLTLFSSSSVRVFAQQILLNGGC